LRRFIEYIKTCQLNGAYFASPLYRPYKKVWLRDQAFITTSLMKHGVRVINEIYWLKALLELEQIKVTQLLSLSRNDPQFLNQDLHPRARYTSDFKILNAPWSERQYDGIALAYGTILSFEIQSGEHVLKEGTKDLYDRYLMTVFDTPCADLWEMHDDYIHVETLGSIYYALNLRLKGLNRGTRESLEINSFLENLRREIYGFEKDGVVLKSKKSFNTEPVGLDASVIILFTLFGVIKDLDLLNSTLLELYYYLSPDGLGLRRFIMGDEKDVYFGGGVWYILNYWAAEGFAKIGNKRKARALLEYRYRFPLPEQINDDTLIFSSEGKEVWIERSRTENAGIPGPANPLLWSISEFARVFPDVAI